MSTPPDIVPSADPQDEIAALREQIAELQRELETARSNSGTSAAELSELRRQLDDAQRELAALRPSPSPVPSGRRLDGFFEVEDPE